MILRTPSQPVGNVAGNVDNDGGHGCSFPYLQSNEGEASARRSLDTYSEDPSPKGTSTRRERINVTTTRRTERPILSP